MFRLGDKVRLGNQGSDILGELVAFRAFDVPGISQAVMMWGVRWPNGNDTIHFESELRLPAPRWLICPKRCECEKLEWAYHCYINSMLLGKYLESLCADCKEE